MTTPSCLIHCREKWIMPHRKLHVTEKEASPFRNKTASKLDLVLDRKMSKSQKRQLVTWNLWRAESITERCISKAEINTQDPSGTSSIVITWEADCVCHQPPIWQNTLYLIKVKCTSSAVYPVSNDNFSLQTNLLLQSLKNTFRTNPKWLQYKVPLGLWDSQLPKSLHAWANVSPNLALQLFPLKHASYEQDAQGAFILNTVLSY